MKKREKYSGVAQVYKKNKSDSPQKPMVMKLLDISSFLPAFSSCRAVSIGHSFNENHLPRPLHGPFFARIPTALMVTIAVQNKN